MLPWLIVFSSSVLWFHGGQFECNTCKMEVGMLLRRPGSVRLDCTVLPSWY